MALVPVWEMAFSEDSVVVSETTGNYSVSNPTGYGAPNPAFGDFNRVMSLKKKNINSVADETLSTIYTPDATNGLGDVVYSTRTKDGWYEFVVLLIETWDSGTAYSGSGTPTTSDVVFYIDTYYRAIANGTNHIPGGAPGYWLAITEEALINISFTSSTNVIRTSVGRVTAFDADVVYATLTSEKTQNGLAGVSTTDRDEARINTIYRTVQQVLVADQLGDNTAGEAMILRLRTMGAKKAGS